MIISDLLQDRPTASPDEIVACDSEDKVSAAVEKMAQLNVGAVVVLEGKNVAGIFTERDLLRGLHSNGAGFLEQRLEQNMTTDVVVVGPDHTLDQALDQMNNHRIRHLPVVEGQRLIGVLSVRDLIIHKLDRVKSTAEFLQQQVQLGSKPLPM